jgi:prepilin-type N-terminal cleavage/methylation domain-containing protein
MMRLAAHKESGFTLIEWLVTIVIGGVFAAVLAPSFSTWADKYRLDNASTQLQGALKEVQQQSIRISQSCSVTIDTSTATISTTTGFTNCLPSGSRDLNNQGVSSGGTTSNGVAIATDSASVAPTVAFTFRGSTSTANVFVLYKPNSTIPMKCLAISQGLGIIRIGRYNSASNPPTSVSASNCQTTAQ